MQAAPALQGRDAALNDGGQTVRALRDIAAGAKAPYESVSLLLRHPRLVAYSILPFLVTVVIYVGAFWLCWHFIPEWLPSAGAGASWWRRALLVTVKVLIVIAFSALSIFTYSAAALAVGGPLNEFLSCAAEKVVTGEVFEYEFSVLGFLLDMVRGGLHAGMLVVVQLVIVIVGFIAPPVSTIIAFFIGQVLLAVEYVDYPMSRHRYSFAKKLAMSWRHRWLMFGFGASLFCGYLVPVLGAVFMPLGVIGAINIWVRMKPGEEERTQ